VFTGFAGIIVTIAILLLGFPVFTLAPWQAFSVMTAGALLVASYIPYMIAMQREEASIVASLYRLIPIFVFALSYIALGETLQPKQIVGGCVTITGAILLVVDLDKRGRGFDLVTFYLMGAACLMNACTVLIFKSIAIKASLWSSAFWEYVGAAIFSLTLIGVVPSHRCALRALLGSRDVYVLVPITLSGRNVQSSGDPRRRLRRPHGALGTRFDHNRTAPIFPALLRHLVHPLFPDIW
jgi:uncharacterized membrane protein